MKKKHVLKCIYPLIFLVSASAVADEILPPFPRAPLNKIDYQVTVEKWATTDTANVTVNVDAVLDKIGLANINSHVLENLHKMASDADWHVTQFDRTQDKSGLEMLHIAAEARLSQDKLTGLRDKAKDITKPGETYTIGDIDFTPSKTEIEKTEAAARSDVYAQVKQEIESLNKTYPEQHYFLHEIAFNVPTNGPMPMAFKGARVMAVEVNTASSASNIPVNAKITEIAQVVIASKVPMQKPQKIEAEEK